MKTNTPSIFISSKSTTSWLNLETITRNVEQVEHNIMENEFEIQIIDSIELIRLCGKCGNAFDADLLSTIIQSIPPSHDSRKLN